VTIDNAATAGYNRLWPGGASGSNPGLIEFDAAELAAA
jgi:hypothetical protein